MGIEKIYSDIVREHSNSDKFKHHIQNPTIILKGDNPNCGDEIEIEVKEKDGIIEEISFMGYGCAISQASSSIMCDIIKDKTLKEAATITKTFIGMLRQDIKEDDKLQILGRAIALKEVANIPARVKCASLAWNTLENILTTLQKSK